ncbi:alpha/beta fold hydrolase [Rubripirellula sp.]|nr:alpha/beta fold hydrolase [Rubripirellula sp.]MDB4749282.1 alpha/beta fold hydrolase [Rubripirellula sp.]
MVPIVHGNMPEFEPPPFDPHRFFKGGHLQTLAATREVSAEMLCPIQHVVSVSDGDSIVLHEDCPVDWEPGKHSILLVHGLSGCHTAPYMLRLAERFLKSGSRVFRMDMRGCGAARSLTRNLAHAGRSDDLVSALDVIAERSVGGPMLAIGVSLGAGQLLRAVGRIGCGHTTMPKWFARLKRIAVVAPPLDLRRCSINMQRWRLRPYNYYFIRALLGSIPPGVDERADFQQAILKGRPRTLWELDDRITAPLSGFDGAADYYQQASACHVASSNPVPTLVLTAADDPIVPVGCFADDPSMWPKSTRLFITPTGGHMGFLDRHRRCWIDEAVSAWFSN